MRLRWRFAVLLSGSILGLAGCAGPKPIVLHPVVSAPLSKPRQVRSARTRPRPGAGETAACAANAETAAMAPPNEEALFRAFTAEETAARSRPSGPVVASAAACHVPRP